MITERLVAMYAIYEKVRREGNHNMLTASAALRMREMQTPAHISKYGVMSGEDITEVVANFDELTRIRGALDILYDRAVVAAKRKRNPSNLARAFIPLRRRKYFCRQNYEGRPESDKHLYLTPTSYANWNTSKRARVHLNGDWHTILTALQNEGITLTREGADTFIST